MTSTATHQPSVEFAVQRSTCRKQASTLGTPRCMLARMVPESVPVTEGRNKLHTISAAFSMVEEASVWTPQSRFR